MLPRQDRNDEDAFDVAAGVEAYWMRSFSALRMTAKDGAAMSVQPPSPSIILAGATTEAADPHQYSADPVGRFANLLPPEVL